MFNKFLIWLCLIPFIALDGATLRVKKSNQSTSVDPTELGSSWSKAFTNLQDALATAEAGDEIWVAEGTYLPTEGATFQSGYEREQSFSLVDGVSLYGGFKGLETNRLFRQGDTNKTILSGEIHDNSNYWSLHVITGHGLTSDIIIDGFRIEKGNANGVLNPRIDPTGKKNVKGLGGGIFLWDFSGNLIINNCIFSENYSLPEHGNGNGSCIFAQNASSNGRFEIFVSNTRIHNNHSNSSIYFQIRNEINKLDFSNVDFSDNIGNSLLLHDDDRVENGSPGSTSPDLVISEAIFSNCTFNRNQDIDTISFNSKSAKFDNCLFKKN